MEPHIQRLIIHMTVNYQHAMPMQQLAALVNLSASRMTHLFKRETGMPPQAFLKQVRMSRATQLLKTTCLSVKEVMCLTGFNDASHFTKDFAQRYGLTPSEYRSSYLADSAEKMVHESYVW